MYAVCGQATCCKIVRCGVGSACARHTCQVGIHSQQGVSDGVHHKVAGLLIDLRDDRQPEERPLP